MDNKSFLDEDDYCNEDTESFWYKKILNIISAKEKLVLADAFTLIDNITIWERQRLLEPKRVEELIDYQLEQKKKYNRWRFIGNFYVCILGHQHLLIDGQHRLQSIKQLINKYNYPSFDVIVWTFHVDNEEEIIDIFQNINKMKPMSLPDLMQDQQRDIINYACHQLMGSYKKFFSNSILGNPRRPNIKLDDLKNNLYDKKVIKKLNITDGAQLLQMIENQNKHYSRKDPSYFPVIGKTNNTSILEKSKKKGGLYLGMYPHYDWIDSMIDIQTFKMLENESQSENNDIPKESTINNVSKSTSNLPSISQSKSTSQSKSQSKSNISNSECCQSTSSENLKKINIKKSKYKN